MLIGIPEILSPKLVKILMEMGHGDEILLADRNFPCAAKAKRLVRCDGICIEPLLRALAGLFPLDYAGDNAFGMLPPPDVPHEAARDYAEILKKCGDYKSIVLLQKPAFYERANQVYAVAATGDSRRFANLILRKGVI